MIHVVQFSEQKNWKIEINSLKNGLQNVKLESQNLGKGILFLASQNGAKKDHIANVITYDEYQFINYCFRSFMCALNTIEILFHMLLCNKMRKQTFSAMFWHHTLQWIMASSFPCYLWMNTLYAFVYIWTHTQYIQRKFTAQTEQTELAWFCALSKSIISLIWWKV